MFYLLAALIVGVIGALPLAIRGKFIPALIQACITIPVGYGIIYLSNPSTVWPLFGLPGLLTVVWWLIGFLIDSFMEDKASITGLFLISAILVYIVRGCSGSAAFRAHEYANLIGPVKERVWTQNVQPKDPAHMRMSTEENAIYQAKKVLGAAGAIGSQFEVVPANMTLQMINKELWYVVPLDFSGFSVWLNTQGSPGYIKVHGEDPHKQPEIVMLKEGAMRYMPGAFFGYNLERHLRNNGYLNVALSDWTFEIDENNKAWWVITVYKPTIAWSGEKITGVVIVDPVTGDNTFHQLGKIHGWVDRADPGWITENYLKWQGLYSDGWLNSWWGLKGLTKPEPPALIYGTGDQPEWVFGITSASQKDDSLVALVYTNSRTGKSIRYKIKGGGTDSAIKDAVDKNQQVQFRHLHAVDPQLYNVYGVPTSVVPLLNESHAYQGVAMVPINDVQAVAVGSNQYEALRIYEKLLAEGGQRVAFDKKRTIKIIEGMIDRFGQEVIPNTGTVYYLHLVGIPQLFTAGAGESPELPVTKEGNNVRIEYYASDYGRDVVPMRKFDNLSLELSVSKTQQQVREKVEERRTAQEKKDDINTATERLKKLSPEEMQKLLEKVPPTEPTEIE